MIDIRFKVLYAEQSHELNTWYPVRTLDPSDRIKIGKSFIIKVDGIVYDGTAKEELNTIFDKILLWQALND